MGSELAQWTKDESADEGHSHAVDQCLGTILGSRHQQQAQPSAKATNGSTTYISILGLHNNSKTTLTNWSDQISRVPAGRRVKRVPLRTQYKYITTLVHITAWCITVPSRQMYSSLTTMFKGGGGDVYPKYTPYA